MRSRLAAVSAICLLLAVEATAQGGNQLSFSDITARTGQQRVLSLNGTFTEGMSGMVVTVLFDPAVIQVLDVSLTSLTSDFTLESRVSSGRISLAMAAAQEIQSLVPEPVVDVTVRVIGAPGAVTSLSIASAVVNEGELTVSLTDGLLTVVREASVLGWVLYYADLKPVPDVSLDATGTAQHGATSDNDGRYELGPMAVGDYAVAISRGDDGLDAIDALDAADILRHLIGAIDLSPDQALVGDVSGNGVIGTTDAGLILRYLVGLEQSFPAGDFWQFRPAEMRFQPLIQDQFQNLTGFLLGDVDGSWEAQGGAKRLAAAGPQLQFEALPVQGRRGALLLTSDSDEPLRGGYVDVRYDPRVLAVTSVRRAGLGDGFLVAANTDHDRGRIRAAFAGGTPAEGTADLLRIDFDEIGTPGSTTLVAVRSARLNRTDLPPAALAREAYRLDRHPADFNTDGLVNLSDFFLFIDFLGSTEARFDLDGDGQVDLTDLFMLFDALNAVERAKAVAVAGARGLDAGTALEQNAPNPFNAETAIAYRTVAAGPVQLAVYDLAGQRVRVLAAGQRPAGAYRAVWDGRDASGRAVASGVYLYRLQTADGTVERKLLLLR